MLNVKVTLTNGHVAEGQMTEAAYNQLISYGLESGEGTHSVQRNIWPDRIEAESFATSNIVSITVELSTKQAQTIGLGQ